MRFYFYIFFLMPLNTRKGVLHRENATPIGVERLFYVLTKSRGESYLKQMKVLGRGKDEGGKQVSWTVIITIYSMINKLRKVRFLNVKFKQYRISHILLFSTVKQKLTKWYLQRSKQLNILYNISTVTFAERAHCLVSE